MCNSTPCRSVLPPALYSYTLYSYTLYSYTLQHLTCASPSPCCTCRLCRRCPSEALNSWSGNIGRLLVLVEKTCQQIQKESMVHRVPIGAA